ncbi:hypothetical protein [Aurantimonas endophytica]|uniref:Uncharacterized protein n=1 Tax=Aurantimonas endophytica TaxID=1522175 RepID=A0A7W6MQX9_9HYPH|nr:hypothetical protein [Aurantimonas endophytica]MBB4004472.1 hypothetical protein [Aurantimonas endophytica]MCO6405308.1 hypothetical protein [Aurantimonas endophytica]
MSKTDPVTENPNDKMPKGKPRDPDRIVSEDDAGSAPIEQEQQDERDDDLLNGGPSVGP